MQSSQLSTTFGFNYPPAILAPSGTISVSPQGGADGISLSTGEAEKMSNITNHPSLRHRLHNKGSQSLIGWLKCSIRDTWSSPKEVRMYIREDVRTGTLLWELDRRKAIYDAEFTGQLGLCSRGSAGTSRLVQSLSGFAEYLSGAGS